MFFFDVIKTCKKGKLKLLEPSNRNFNLPEKSKKVPPLQFVGIYEISADSEFSFPEIKEKRSTKFIEIRFQFSLNFHERNPTPK